MTDMSKFEGHTEGHWNVIAFNASTIILREIVTPKNILLIEAAPKLLQRVKELEEFIHDYIATDCMTRNEAQKLGREILEKAWL